MEERSIPVGSVMVLGGGIGGMQAALDLADSGFKVYLVDQAPCIGGKMAQLDKTFPTNDCAMCTMAPRLVGVARHLNIEIITLADVMGLSGDPGDFKVRLRERARYIDPARCTGCGLCESECPITLPKEFEEGLSTRKAIYKLYPQAVPGSFAIEKRGMAPCRFACPAGLSVQGYLALAAQGKFKEALEVIYRDIPFAAVCGRICPHFCEANCTRQELDDPLSIKAIKRFLADYNKEIGNPPASSEKISEKIALVGGGPSSIAAAYHLRRMGYGVVIFEKSDKLGGMLRSVVPRYRLPEEILDLEIDRVLSMGIDLKTGVTVGSDVTLEGLKHQGFSAVHIATGLSVSKRLPVPGVELPQVVYALDFLQRINRGDLPEVAPRVLVIGGGNVAIDAARSALRLGAREVSMMCLESAQEMPAHPWEIEEAKEEGIKINCSSGPLKIVGKEGKVTGVETILCTSVFDKEGRFAPTYDESKTGFLPADMVIIAIGQGFDPVVFSGLSEDGIKTLRANAYLPADSGIGIPIFLGGDLKRGPASAIEAMADGAEVALKIDDILSGRGIQEKYRPPEPARATITEETPVVRRRAIPTLSFQERIKDFREIEGTYTEKDAMEEASRCLSCGICSECFRCETVCEAGALQHNMPPEREREIEVGAIILAPGFEIFNAEERPQYGFGRWKNVVSSLQFERILSAGGPFMGHIQRLSDGAEPGSIAFLQCIGSREQERQYCSSVCCMYAIKQAIIAKEHCPHLEIEIFYIDIRAFGKGFEAYYERAKELGIRFTRCSISSIKEVPSNKNLVLYAADNGKVTRREFEMVVLSCGFSHPSTIQTLSKNLDLKVGPYGFFKTDKFAPLSSNKEGIYVSGAFTEPKDIPDTVSQASGAASKAMSLLAAARGTQVVKKDYPPEISVDGQEPRVGVFICHCGKNIGGVLDVPALVEYSKTIGGVVYSEENLYTCSQDSLVKIKEAIKKESLNRVVVASCTPRTHEPLFQEALREVGLNPFLFEMADIRDQCSWVHMSEPERATNKAAALIKMAVAKIKQSKALHKTSIKVTQKAMVIGGGLAGMTAALELATQGYPVYLVERSATLGGNMRKIYITEEGKDVQGYLEGLLRSVRGNPLITVFLESTLQECSGFQGSFHGKIRTPEGVKELDFGVVIVATGAMELRPDEYLYGKDSRVLTLQETEEYLHEKSKELEKGKKIVFIQCVGSRNEERQYCSRTCCTRAIKAALRIKEINPQIQIYVLYRDIRTYGFREELYFKARQNGIIFIHHPDEVLPELARKDGRLSVSVLDTMLDTRIEIEPDMVVLSTATIPPEGAKDLSDVLKIPLSEEGFFLEAHMKLRPVEFASDGMFICGLAHYPKFIEETIAQACACVSRANTILSKEYLEVGGIVAVVQEDKCAFCLTCVRSCPYGVPQPGGITKKAAVNIQVAQCHGCGICASECPAKAIELMNYTDAQIIEMNRELLKERVENSLKVY